MIDTSTAAVQVEAAYVDSPLIAALLCALAAERDALKWRLDCIMNETGQTLDRICDDKRAARRMSDD